MFVVSADSPAYYLTSVTKDRLPVFRLDTMKTVACNALGEARTSCGFLLFAYVIMPDHIHLVTDSEQKAKRVLQFVNGIVSRRVIDFLKQQGYESSLRKLQHEEYERRHKYSLWDHHPNIRLLTSEEMFMQRVNYTHQNPVRAGLVNRVEDYRFSGVRIWKGESLEDEPVMMDLDKIKWRAK